MMVLKLKYGKFSKRKKGEMKKKKGTLYSGHLSLNPAKEARHHRGGGMKGER